MWEMAFQTSQFWSLLNKTPNFYLQILSFTKISTCYANLRQLRLYSYERRLFSGFGDISDIFVRFCAHLWGHAENSLFMTLTNAYWLYQVSSDMRSCTVKHRFESSQNENIFFWTQIFPFPLNIMNYFLLYYLCTWFGPFCQRF